MRAGYLQYQVAHIEPDKNMATISRLLGNEKFDLLVLPELALSGYLMPSREKAFELASEFGEGETFDFFRRLAKKHDGAVVFGFPERDGDKLYNSAAAVLPDGSLYRYRKVHLFDQEKTWSDLADSGFDIFTFRGALIGMMICFDWIFPESARTLMLKGADIICHPSNLVMPYCQRAMVTRSLENGVFTITCNRFGSEEVRTKKLIFTGGSQILDTYGRILASSDVEGEDLRLVEIDPAAARDKNVTDSNNLAADRRPDHYIQD